MAASKSWPGLDVFIEIPEWNGVLRVVDVLSRDFDQIERASREAAFRKSYDGQKRNACKRSSHHPENQKFRC